MQSLNVQRSTSHFMPTILACLLILAFQVGRVNPVAAAPLTMYPFTVNTTADTHDVNLGDTICADSSGLCSLRAAIEEADALPAGSVIIITVPANTYTLTMGTLSLTNNSITINGFGPSSSSTIITEAKPPTFTILSVSSGASATLKLLTITGGSGSGSGSNSGGGIFNGHGTVTVDQSTISNNTAPNSDGGGIRNSGTMIVSNSTVSGNSADMGGGISQNGGGTLTVTNSTFTGNSATFSGYGGGAIFNCCDTVTVSNSTFSGNTANGQHGSDIANNHGTFTLAATIVANVLGNPSLHNCSGTITDNHNNLDSGTSCNFLNLNTTNPKLGPLQGNGGPTQTMALLQNSPAIDHIPTSSGSCPPTDQRGYTRPDDGEGTCDIGAYESSAVCNPGLENLGSTPQGNSPSHIHPVIGGPRNSSLTNARPPSSQGPDAGNLLYHGGPIMAGTQKTYAIFWEPTGSYVSPTYNSLIERYFGDVGSSPLYHNIIQYTDSLGHFASNAVLAGDCIDQSPYPGGILSDAQIQQEVTKVSKANGWKANANNNFFVFTAKGENICTSFGCSFSTWCAYHGNFGNTTYAVMPYAGTSLSTCWTGGNSPNHDVDADAEINLISQQQMTAATDPHLNAWYDASGLEIGDKCAWTFGTVRPDGSNVTWNGHEYIVQQEWDNKTSSCVLSGP